MPNTRKEQMERRDLQKLKSGSGPQIFLRPILTNCIDSF